MTSTVRDKLEADIRRECLKSHFNAATTLALQGYGPEIFGFLLGLHREDDAAADVFSVFSERVWKGLAKFDWTSSFRTWAYTIARNASLTYRASAAKHARRFRPLPDGSVIEEVAEQVRSQTQSYLRTSIRDKVARLRDSLSTDEQTLLTLRLDRKLQWLEIAQIMRDEDAPMKADDLKRDSAKLRQRFQIIKEKLRKLSSSPAEDTPLDDRRRARGEAEQ